MKWAILYHSKSTSAICSFAGLLTLGLVMLLEVSSVHADLSFFKAVEEKIAYNKNPVNYERVILPPGSGREEVYVERKSALKIQPKEIESVSAEKSNVDKDAQKAIEEALRLMGREPKMEDTRDYTVTFSLNREGAKKFRAFAQKHNQQLFDVRFKTVRLGIITLVGPFEGNVFSAVGLKENAIKDLKMVHPSLTVK